MKNSVQKNKISFIGEYQLGNLLSNQVKFLFYYVMESDEEKFNHPLLETAESHSVKGILEKIEGVATDKAQPIVLVCESGENSKTAASILFTAGYYNIFVLEGGVSEL